MGFRIRIALQSRSFLNWLVLEGEVEISGAVTKCYRVEQDMDDDSLNEWSSHIRKHYRRNKEQNYDRDGDCPWNINNYVRGQTVRSCPRAEGMPLVKSARPKTAALLHYFF